MRDNFGREITYLRVSITDCCNLRCSYCNPQGNIYFKNEDLLCYEEIIEVIKCAVPLGIKHVRVTGGEPFARKDCLHFIKQLIHVPGLQSVSITTNGTLLKKDDIRALKQMGVSGINISLDTVNKEQYRKITGEDQIERVFSAISECQKHQLPFKLNAVLMSKTQVLSMLAYLKEQPVILRFIEQMPMKEKQKEEQISGTQVLSLLQEQGISYHRTQEVKGFGPAVYYRMDGYQGILGLIEPIHGKFCDSCNRIRMTANGDLKGCLYYPGSVHLSDSFKANKTSLERNTELTKKIQEAIQSKPECHRFEEKPAKDSMNEIGG